MLQVAAPRTITYTRKGAEGIALTASVAMHDYEVAGQDNFVTSVQFWDWTITASELGITPRQGDRITETLNSVALTYEVLPIDKRPCFESLDTANLLLKVHTKKVAS
jgi:hypothetical protein